MVSVLGRFCTTFFLCITGVSLFVSCGVKIRNPDLSSIPEHTILTVLAGQSTSDPGIEEFFTEAIGEKMDNVDLYWERMDWGEQFKIQMLSRFAAGEIPDIMIGKAQDVSTYAPSGNLAVIQDELVDFIRPEIIPSVSFSEKVYGIPYNAFYQGVLYNKELFSTYNMKIPETLEELNTAIEHFKKAGVVPFAAHFEENWSTANVFMQLAIGEVFSRNENWGAEFGSGKQSFRDSRDIELCLDGLEFIKEFTWGDPYSVNLFESDQRFANSKAAMYLTGTWSLQNIEALNPGLQIGIFPYPNSTGDAKLIIEPNLTFMKSAYSDNSDTIDKVLKILLEDEELAVHISDYTQTSTVLKSQPHRYPQLVAEDITLYEEDNLIVDATGGNTQLPWSFQDALAKETLKWMRGEMSRDVLLDFADSNRMMIMQN